MLAEDDAEISAARGALGLVELPWRRGSGVDDGALDARRDGDAATRVVLVGATSKRISSLKEMKEMIRAAGGRRTAIVFFSGKDIDALVCGGTVAAAAHREEGSLVRVVVRSRKRPRAWVSSGSGDLKRAVEELLASADARHRELEALVGTVRRALEAGPAGFLTAGSYEREEGREVKSFVICRNKVNVGMEGSKTDAGTWDVAWKWTENNVRKSANICTCAFVEQVLPVAETIYALKNDADVSPAANAVRRELGKHTGIDVRHVENIFQRFTTSQQSQFDYVGVMQRAEGERVHQVFKMEINGNNGKGNISKDGFETVAQAARLRDVFMFFNPHPTEKQRIRYNFPEGDYQKLLNAAKTCTVTNKMILEIAEHFIQYIM